MGTLLAEHKKKHINGMKTDDKLALKLKYEKYCSSICCFLCLSCFLLLYYLVTRKNINIDMM